MPQKNRTPPAIERWSDNVAWLHSFVPHFASWALDSGDFVELRVKARDDSTLLAIAKGYSSDGGPIVAFGVGYDLISCLMALDGTIQGGHWREDKPWQPK